MPNKRWLLVVGGSKVISRSEARETMTKMSVLTFGVILTTDDWIRTAGQPMQLLTIDLVIFMSKISKTE